MKPQKGAKSIRNKMISAFCAFCLFCAFSWLTFSAQKKTVPVDPNRFAVIITGASGDATYAKQFEQWTTELSSVLSERFGFDSRQIKVLPEKQATAEEVKRTF